MDGILKDLLLMSAAVYVIGRVMPGVKLEGLVSAVLVGWLIGLTAPLVTAGLAALGLAAGLVELCSIVANGLFVMIYASFVPGFTVEHFRAAFFFYMAAAFLHLMLTQIVLI